jgi:ABC-2 type transport system permease protein
MLRKIFDVALLQLKTTFQERATLIFGLVMPLVFTFVIGLGISGFEPDEDAPPSTWTVSVVDMDQGQLSQQLVDNLEAKDVLVVEERDADEAAAALEAGEAAATLILPAGMTEALLVDDALDLEFQLSVEDQVAAQVVEQAVLAAMNELSSSLDIAAISLSVAEEMNLFEVEGGPDRDQYYADAIGEANSAWQAGAPITVTAQKETQREDTSVQIPNGFQQTSPGIAVMFALFFVANGAGTLLIEREQGTLRRLIITPISKGGILAGKLLGVFVSSLVQFTLLVLAGQFLFGVDWGQAPLALAVMVLAFTFCITALAMLMASLVRTYAQIDAVSTLLIIPLSGIGGAMWPIEIVPPFMQQAALYVPTGWAMRGFHDIVTRGLGLEEILLEAGVLVLFGIAFLAIGVWRFKYE